MHEMGIVLHLAKTLEKDAIEKHIVKIEKVVLQVGEVSGIMTDLFSDCWDYFKEKHPLLKDSTLVIEQTKAITHCDSCGKDYETIKYGRQCPYCESYETWLITGNQCVIKEIEAQTEEDLK